MHELSIIRTMEQHPVPQPITSYEFRLIGDMTIRQFGKLAAGIILALIVYAIDPPGFIKWPLIILFSLVGVAMAFLPFEGRPLDTWILAFFKRIYSPTQYVWKQNNPTGNIQPQAPAQAVPQTNIQTQPANLSNTLSSIPPLPSIPTIPSTPITPSIPTSPLSSPQVNYQPTAPSSYQQRPAPAPHVYSATTQSRNTSGWLDNLPPPDPYARKRPQNLNIADARFIQGTLPAVPTMANLLVGLVKDINGGIVEGAILEIRDSTGIPVRAFKTNKLGQFQSATPLPNGIFEIETERDGYAFDIIKVELKGAVVSPIEIVSK